MIKRQNAYWLFLFVLIVALPLFAGLGYALMYSFGLAGILARGFTFEHWAAVFGSGEMLLSILYSAIIGVVSIGLAGGIALVLVLRYPQRLARGWPGLSRYLPLCIPPVAAGFFSFQFLTNGGLLSSLAYKLGLVASQQEFPALVQDRFAIGIVLTHILLALPFFLLLMGSLYDRLGLPAFLIQARSLGASPAAARRSVGRMVLLRAAFPTLVISFSFLPSF
jgi:putative spermidine/putrescine transport system permease protein